MGLVCLIFFSFSFFILLYHCEVTFKNNYLIYINIFFTCNTLHISFLLEVSIGSLYSFSGSFRSLLFLSTKCRWQWQMFFDEKSWHHLLLTENLFCQGYTYFMIILKWFHCFYFLHHCVYWSYKKMFITSFWLKRLKNSKQIYVC